MTDGTGPDLDGSILQEPAEREVVGGFGPGHDEARAAAALMSSMVTEFTGILLLMVSADLQAGWIAWQGKPGFAA